MIISSHVSGLLIGGTLAVGLVLSLLPVPAPWTLLRPEFYPATVLFWVLMQPPRVGVGLAWCGGILIDVVYGTPLTEHGLALAVAAYLVVRLRELLWTFPFWQQALLLAPVFTIYEFVLFWIDGVAGVDINQWGRWLPIATTVLIWPIWAAILERIAELEVG